MNERPADQTAMRAAIVAEARSWIGTPYHPDAAIKGVGVDCARFVAEVHFNAGAVERTGHEAYAPDWFAHTAEQRLRAEVMRHGFEIAEPEVKPGDVVLYRLGRVYAHAAIVVDWPREIIHAHLLSRMVRAMAPFDADLRRRRDVTFYSLWG